MLPRKFEPMLDVKVTQKKDKPLIVFDDQEKDTLSFGGRSNDWA
jgi:hypothetical protein